MTNTELQEAILKNIYRRRRPVPDLKRVKYKVALVTFFDLLGFRDFVVRAPAQKVAQALSLFYYSGKEPGDGKQKSIYVHAFSDSIVRIRLVPQGRVPPEHFQTSPLVLEIHDLARIQFELACWYGLFLRGGITLGDIYTRGGIVFGPALIEAYDIESRHAVYPRILIDPNIFLALQSTTDLFTRLSDEMKQVYGGGAEYAERDATSSGLSDAMIIDEEGCVFIDYVNENIKGADLEFVALHQSAIISSYSDAKTDRVRQKYGWLAQYHNYTIRTDINFDEIGMTAENVDKFSVSDPAILGIITPRFTRLRRFEDVEIGRLKPLRDA